jgi:prepilin-type N-terminal cleavage/methylation domain-containing protein
VKEEPVHDSSGGFTLIELVTVLVVIGLLAALAVPKFAGSREGSIVATMQSDLHNLATFQEDYLLDSAIYYSGPIPSPALSFKPSSGVTVTLQNVTQYGWAATSTHSATSRTCAFYVGPAGPLGPATTEGVVGCT